MYFHALLLLFATQTCFSQSPSSVSASSSICPIGFYRFQDTCSPCIEGCSLCSDDATCERCDQLHSLSSSRKSCLTAAAIDHGSPSPNCRSNSDCQSQTTCENNKCTDRHSLIEATTTLTASLLLLQVGVFCVFALAILWSSLNKIEEEPMVRLLSSLGIFSSLWNSITLVSFRTLEYSELSLHGAFLIVETIILYFLIRIFQASKPHARPRALVPYSLLVELFRLTVFTAGFIAATTYIFEIYSKLSSSRTLGNINSVSNVCNTKFAASFQVSIILWSSTHLIYFVIAAIGLSRNHPLFIPFYIYFRKDSGKPRASDEQFWILTAFASLPLIIPTSFGINVRNIVESALGATLTSPFLRKTPESSCIDNELFQLSASSIAVLILSCLTVPVSVAFTLGQVARSLEEVRSQSKSMTLDKEEGVRGGGCSEMAGLSVAESSA